LGNDQKQEVRAVSLVVLAEQVAHVIHAQAERFVLAATMMRQRVISVQRDGTNLTLGKAVASRAFQEPLTISLASTSAQTAL